LLPPEIAVPVPHRDRLMIDLIIMYGGIIVLAIIISGCTRMRTGAAAKTEIYVEVEANDGQCEVHFEVDKHERDTTDDQTVEDPIGGIR
jgi:hypothetical protein